MSSINSIGSMSSGMAMMQGMRRPDPAKMAENLFSKLDTSGQGYLQKSDLQTAFDGIASVSGSSETSSTNVDDLFSQLDTDSDGKVTKDEFSSSLSKLAEQLEEQFQSMRMQGGMGGPGGMGRMPPPPPPADDSGFTQEELSSQLEAIGETDSQRASLISNIVENFETADTDGDGNAEMRLMQQIMRLMQAYNGDGGQGAAASTLSVTA